MSRGRMRFTMALLVLIVLAAAITQACDSNSVSGRYAKNEVLVVIPTSSSPTNTPTPSPSPTPSPTPTPAVYNARLAFVGDLMVHEEQIESAYNNATGSYDYMPCFEAVAPYLQDADYTLGNLELTLSGPEAGYTGYPVFNAPDEFAEALKAVGFDFVSTANNHANDRREGGILRTIDTLDRIGLDHAGTYATEEDQARVFLKEINGITFAFLCYSYSNNGIPLTSGKPWLLNMLDEDLMKRQIVEAREQGAEVIVVFPHMGDEYAETPGPRYQDLVRRLFGYGADIVMASHPHVLQPAEAMEVWDEDGKARTCFVAYSMANFVSSQRTVPRDVGGIFYLDFEKVVEFIDYEYVTSVILKQASFAPTWVQYTSPRGTREIKVVPMYDILTTDMAGEPTGMRPQDVNRMREAHKYATRHMLGFEVPLESMQPVYKLYHIHSGIIMNE